MKHYRVSVTRMLPMQPYYLPSSPNVPLPSLVTLAQGLAQTGLGTAG